jgi:hypothetical protein
LIDAIFIAQPKRVLRVRHFTRALDFATVHDLETMMGLSREY